MAHLWINTSDGWTVLPLAADRFTLSAHTDPPVRSLAAEEVLAGRIVLRRTPDHNGGEGWVLLAPPRTVWANGQPLFAGTHLLRDKDELRLRGAAPIFFSTETLARVGVYPGGARPAHCPRCRQVIEAGTPAVQCPSCHMWHHQTAGCECWTYAATCAVCDQTTALDTGYRWTPEETVS